MAIAPIFSCAPLKNVPRFEHCWRDFAVASRYFLGETVINKSLFFFFFFFFFFVFMAPYSNLEASKLLLRLGKWRVLNTLTLGRISKGSFWKRSSCVYFNFGNARESIFDKYMVWKVLVWVQSSWWWFKNLL